jgi:hypothetical protein
LESTAFVAERRRELDLRVAFDEVFSRVESLYDTSRTWGGAELTTLAYRVLRESYPQLDAQRVQTLVVAMRRVHRQRRAQGVRGQSTNLPATAQVVAMTD